MAPMVMVMRPADDDAQLHERLSFLVPTIPHVLLPFRVRPTSPAVTEHEMAAHSAASAAMRYEVVRSIC